MKAKTAPPFLIASLRPASSDDSEALMASKAAEEGKASVVLLAAAVGKANWGLRTVLERHCGLCW